MTAEDYKFSDNSNTYVDNTSTGGITNWAGDFAANLWSGDNRRDFQTVAYTPRETGIIDTATPGTTGRRTGETGSERRTAQLGPPGSEILGQLPGQPDTRSPLEISDENPNDSPEKKREKLIREVQNNLDEVMREPLFNPYDPSKQVEIAQESSMISGFESAYMKGDLSNLQDFVKNRGFLDNFDQAKRIIDRHQLISPESGLSVGKDESGKAYLQVLSGDNKNAVRIYPDGSVKTFERNAAGELKELQGQNSNATADRIIKDRFKGAVDNDLSWLLRDELRIRRDRR